MVRAALSLALLLTPAVAGAAIQFLEGTYPDGSTAPTEAYFSGEITSTSATEVKQALERSRKKIGMLYLDSAGGDLIAGMELGDLVRQRGINTSIGKQSGHYGKPLPGTCYSACVLTFSGGHFRIAEKGSRIGIHRFYRRYASSTDLDVGQVVSAAITSYLMRMGVSQILFEKMAQVGGGKTQLLPLSEATSLSLVNNGILAPKWGIEGKQGTVYLKGEQETWNGTGKLIVSCVGHNGVKVSALYDAGPNTRSIYQVTRGYSLRVNSQFLPIPKLLSASSISGDYLVASFTPDPAQLSDIQSAEQIGFGFHPQSSDSFYGFLIDARSDREVIRSFISFCLARD